MTKPTHIEPQDWGKDHFTVLLYAEDEATNNAGEMDPQKLRGQCRDRHGHGDLLPIYPTRLRDGREVQDYDDLDCLDDLERAGLLWHTGAPNYLVSISPDGALLAMHLRQQKARREPYRLPEGWTPAPHMLHGEIQAQTPEVSPA